MPLPAVSHCTSPRAEARGGAERVGVIDEAAAHDGHGLEAAVRVLRKAGHDVAVVHAPAVLAVEVLADVAARERRGRARAARCPRGTRRRGGRRTGTDRGLPRKARAARPRDGVVGHGVPGFIGDDERLRSAISAAITGADALAPRRVRRFIGGDDTARSGLHNRSRGNGPLRGRNPFAVLAGLRTAPGEMRSRPDRGVRAWRHEHRTEDAGLDRRAGSAADRAGGLARGATARPRLEREPRDAAAPPLSPLASRVDRALRNLLKTFPFFAAAVLAVVARTAPTRARRSARSSTSARGWSTWRSTPRPSPTRARWCGRSRWWAS